MKKLLVAILAVTLMAAPAHAANGGKKKAKKKAKVECAKKCSEPKVCPKDANCCPPCNPCPPESCLYIKKVI